MVETVLIVFIIDAILLLFDERCIEGMCTLSEEQFSCRIHSQTR